MPRGGSYVANERADVGTSAVTRGPLRGAVRSARMERRRARTTRALANDERILDGTIDVIGTKGIDGFGLRDVAAAAGLTYGALYGRYENSAELLADLWEQRLRQEFRRLAAIAATFGTDLSPTAEFGEGLRAASPVRGALVQALVAAHRIADLEDVVPGQVETELRAAGLRDGTRAAVGLGSLGMLLGIAAFGPIGEPFDDDEIAALVTWLRAGPAGWTGSPPEPDRPSRVAFSTGDPLRDTLLDAGTRVISRSGIRGTSLRRISRASGYSQTAVYAVYESLDALLLDLIDLVIRLSQQPAHLASLVASPDAAAARLAGWMQPEAAIRRRLSLEFGLAGMHDPRIGRTILDLDAELYSRVADTVAPRGTRVNRLLVTLQRAARSANFGSMLLEDVVGGLETVDWRPFAGAVIAGAQTTLAGELREGRAPG